VKTGKEPKSGTRANVTLTLYGKSGAHQRFPLKNKDEQNEFPKGSERVFSVVAENLGRISNIKYEFCFFDCPCAPIRI
jgi:hypothetical protein